MLPQIGKVDRASFDRIIFPHLGKPDRTVLLGPQHGVDAAVIELPDKSVMVIAEDPTFGMPVLMPHFGWAIVHICASDVAVLGVAPRYMTICLMLPPGTADRVLENIWKEVHEECDKLGIAIVGGHTGIYPGIAYPLNGGCTVIGLGKKEQLTPASNARPGDRVIMTKGPAIEATGILAFQAEKQLKQRLPASLVDKAKEHFQLALDADPAYALANLNLGGVLYLEKNQAGAEEAFKRALALVPDMGLAHYNLGMLYRAAGRTAELQQTMDYLRSRGSGYAAMLARGSAQPQKP